MTQVSVPAGLSVLPYLLKRHQRFGRAMGFKARDEKEWRKWRRTLIARLKTITGYDTMQTCPLKPQLDEVVDCGDHTRQRATIQVEPGVVMPFFILAPKAKPGLSGKYPVVLCPHGHASGGKLAPAGVRENDAMTKTIVEYNYDYGVQFARAGLVALCPDARGFGERREPTTYGYPNNLLSSSCQFINQMAYPLGQTVTGMWAWDLHRLTDYAQTRRDWDSSRLGCAGLSGGGLQTLWATALDERIKAAVVSGYFYGYRESLLVLHQNCSCNYVPHMYETADMGDLGALIAPRPLLIETGDEDNLNGASKLKNVTSQVAISRKAYRLLGANASLVHDVFEGGHRWNGTVAVRWMTERLGT